jgi:hypothetical protein
MSPWLFAAVCVGIFAAGLAVAVVIGVRATDG